MKRMKKIFAMLLAFTMILGMTMTASAALPTAATKATATVKNVEVGKNVEVTAYQIVKGKYNTERGFLGYELANGVSIASKEFQPTSDEITAIANEINGGLLQLTSESFEAEQAAEGAEVTDYTAQLTAGYWVVLVRNTVNVYNPMLVGIYWDDAKTGHDNDLVNGTVDATTKWTLQGTDVYAKKSEVNITKGITTIDKEVSVDNIYVTGDVAYGDMVSFEINTTVPDYSKEYSTAVFKITDKMDAGLDLTTDSIKVTVTGTKTDAVYKVKADADKHGFVVEFDSEWLLANGGAAVKVDYSATVNNNATTNFVPNLNKVKLTYTNKPGEFKDTEEKITRHYTFEIDGAVNGTGSTVTEEIRKMGTQIIEGKEVINPLEGAKFAIREKGTTDVIAYATSTAQGLLNFKGLDAYTDYEIYEVEAPKGWTINDTIYTARITAEYDNEGILLNYKVVVTHVNDEGKTVNAESVHSTTDKGKTVTVKNNTTDIPNTKLVKLPSTGGIGTTIFTVAGCGIMIAAAFFFFASRKKEN